MWSIDLYIKPVLINLWMMTMSIVSKPKVTKKKFMTIVKTVKENIVTKPIHTKVKTIVIVNQSTVIKFINTVKKVLFLMTI